MVCGGLLLMEGRDSPGPFSESFCVPVAICGQKGLLTLGRRCRTWATEAGSTLAGCGGKAARRTDWPVGVGCMERAQLRTGRPKVAREVAEHSMDSQKAPFRHIYFVPRQRRRGFIPRAGPPPRGGRLPGISLGWTVGLSTVHSSATTNDTYISHLRAIPHNTPGPAQ